MDTIPTPVADLFTLQRRWARPDLVRLLVSHGANVNAVDKGDSTPLGIAASKG